MLEMYFQHFSSTILEIMFRKNNYKHLRMNWWQLYSHTKYTSLDWTHSTKINIEVLAAQCDEFTNETSTHQPTDTAVSNIGNFARATREESETRRATTSSGQTSIMDGRSDWLIELWIELCKETITRPPTLVATRIMHSSSGSHTVNVPIFLVL